MDIGLELATSLTIRDSSAPPATDFSRAGRCCSSSSGEVSHRPALPFAARPLVESLRSPDYVEQA